MESKLNPEAQPFIPQNDLHPCVNCGKLCKGKQCKECHVKMLQSKCVDCNILFNARRRDGTMRKRCGECQTNFNNKFIRKCPDCNNEFHKGKDYDTCLECFKQRKETEKKEYEEKKKLKDERKKKYEEMEKKKCQTKNCQNMTGYKFCQNCNKNRKELNTYMVFTCKGCGYKGYGDYSYCNNCS